MLFFYKTFALLFAIIDPLAVLPIFIALTRNYSDTLKKTTAFKAVAVASSILIVFVFLGDFILDTLEISVPAFQIAGGILLFLCALDMISGKSTGINGPTEQEKEEMLHQHDISVFPLAIPLLAGPGAMTTVTMRMRVANNDPFLIFGLFIVIVLIMLFTYLILRLSGPISKFLSTNAIHVITKVFGVLVAAMSVQMSIWGIKQIFLLTNT